MADKAKADIEESQQAIADLQEQLGELREEMEAELDAVEAKWLDLMDDTREVPVAPRKTDVRLPLFGVAWLPHYLASDAAGRAVELAAYAAE